MDQLLSLPYFGPVSCFCDLGARSHHIIFFVNIKIVAYIVVLSQVKMAWSSSIRAGVGTQLK